jgi:N-methylhydantoinase A
VREQFRGPVDGAALTIERSVGLRFRRQVHELVLSLPSGDFSEADLDRLAERFSTEYERQFGEGTAYAVAGIELVGLRVEASIPLGVELPERPEHSQRDPVGERSVWFDGATVRCPVFDGRIIAADMPVAGPAVIEVPTTTTVVYPGQVATVDAVGTTILRVS